MAVKGKKVAKENVDGQAESTGGLIKIVSKAELKTFLLNVRDKLMSGAAPPIFAMSALNHVMQLEDIYDLMDTTNKEILQEIWVKLSQSGMQMRKPPLLFGDIEIKANA